MVIQSLDLRHFRNYTHLKADFSPGINWIYGKNGQGKTNLVEAIYYICNLESFRTRKNVHLLQSGHPQALVQAELKRIDVLHLIRIQVTSRGRQVFLDHSVYNKVSDYILSFLALTFTPEEVVLFRGSPQERRRFFNRIQAILEPSYFRTLQDYAQALSQKNAVLKLQQKEKLPLWNQMLARHAWIMMQKRKSFTESLNLHLADLFHALCGRKERLELLYQPSLVGQEETEHAIQETLEMATEKELRVGHSLLGPHRDDFQLMMDQKPDREFFSQGEFRITNLALKMTLNQLMFQMFKIHPVLIFDDLFSELDQTMNSRIMDYFSQLDNQVFITSTIPPERVKPGNTLQISQGKAI